MELQNQIVSEAPCTVKDHAASILPMAYGSAGSAWPDSLLYEQSL